MRTKLNVEQTKITRNVYFSNTLNQQLEFQRVNDAYLEKSRRKSQVTLDGSGSIRLLAVAAREIEESEMWSRRSFIPVLL